MLGWRGSDHEIEGYKKLKKDSLVQQLKAADQKLEDCEFWVLGAF